MMNKNTLKNLKELLDHVVRVNLYHVFPFYDTEYVQSIKDKIKFMENSKEEYDKEPVVACRYCKSLDIRTDDEENDHCWRCNSLNSLIEYKNIFEYEKANNKSK